MLSLSLSLSLPTSATSLSLRMMLLATEPMRKASFEPVLVVGSFARAASSESSSTSTSTAASAAEKSWKARQPKNRWLAAARRNERKPLFLFLCLFLSFCVRNKNQFLYFLTLLRRLKQRKYFGTKKMKITLLPDNFGKKRENLEIKLFFLARLKKASNGKSTKLILVTMRGGGDG